MAKVYGVRWWNDAWEVCAAEVAEETPTQVTLAQTQLAMLGAFGYRRTHPPAALARTPLEAVTRKLADERAVAKRMGEEIAQQHARINRLAVLEARVTRGDIL